MIHPHSALHFRTVNCAQAFALALAGFPLLEIRNVYSEEQLKKLGCSARQAWEGGHPGTVEYNFEKSPELTACATAWDEEIEKIKSGQDGSALDVAPEKVVRIAAGVLCQRKPFADLWKKVTPHLHLPNPGEPKRIEAEDGVGFRMVFPGFRQISINDKEALSR